MSKLSKSMADCLAYYRDNEHNPDRLQRPPYTWTTREMNRALERGWLECGPGGWHILSKAGRELSATQPENVIKAPDER